MIDTDKYEEIMKHDWLFDEQLFVGGGKWRFALTEYTDLVDMPKKDIEEWEEGLEPVWEALVDFIADAPLLLAEVKRLREDNETLRKMDWEYECLWTWLAENTNLLNTIEPLVEEWKMEYDEE